MVTHPRIKARILLFAGPIFLAAKFLGASEAEAVLPTYRFDAWKTEQGLPQNTVQAIRQTRDGYLWVGTRFGLARFDGVQFTVFNTANTPAMVSDNCMDLEEDLDGSLWIATDDGLLRWQNRRFHRYSAADGLGHDWVWGLAASRAGGVWAATRAGLSRFENGSIRNHTLPPELKRREVNDVLEGRDGRVWIRAAGSVLRFNLDARAFELLIDARDEAGRDVHCIYLDHAGDFWFGSESGLNRWRAGSVTSFKIAAPGRSNIVHHIYETPTGTMWAELQKSGGLYQLRGEQLHRFQLPDFLAGSQFNCLLQDRELNVWAGTRFDGLIRMRRRDILSYTTQDGLGYDDAWSVCEGRDGVIWVATKNFYNRIRNGEVTAYQLPKASNQDIKSILEDRAENLWIAQEAGETDSLLYRLTDGVLTDCSMQAGTRGARIRVLHEDGAGTLWIGTSAGLIRWQEGGAVRQSLPDGLKNHDVRALRTDRAGNLWIGTYGDGVIRLRDGRLTTFTREKDGLTSNSAWSIHEDTDGTLWIGTGLGLNRFKDGRFFGFTRQHGLFDDLVNHVLEDDKRNFWISCNRGVYRVRREELEAVAGGRTNRVQHVAYGSTDGMASNETNGEFQPAGCKDREGRLWFPTTKGVVVIDPKLIQGNTLPPPVVIEQVVADRKVIYGEPASVPFRTEDAALKEVPEPLLSRPNDSSQRKIRLQPGRARVLEFHYTANSFVAPEKVLFKYLLEGHDSFWEEVGTRRVAYYTNLRPGHYCFRVKACNNHGVWNEAGASFAFYLAPHFYQTWPFYGTLGLAIVAAAAGIQAYRLRVQRKLLRLEQQHALDVERTRIAQDMHDDLGANLTKIAILSEVAKRDLKTPRMVELHVEQISATARSVVDLISELVWATNPRNDTLDNFASYCREYAAQFFESTRIQCHLDFRAPSLPLSSELRRNLFLVIKEALHNVVKHSGATEVELQLSLESRDGQSGSRLGPSRQFLCITIEDNGRGFEVNAVSPRGNGLRNMRRRVTEQGGCFEINSQPSGGTHIKISAPMNS